MKKNKYSSYEELIRSEVENEDFVIVERFAMPEMVIIAIHGGGIEGSTSELADAIAGNEYSFYAFVGTKKPDENKAKVSNWDLHISSHQFNEPRCVAMVEKALNVVSVHGCDRSEKGGIFLGGKDVKLKERIAKNLTAAGFSVGITPIDIAALDGNNICNQSSKNAGVQIEIQGNLRAKMFAGNYKKRVGREKTTEVFGNLVAAIRATLNEDN